jgi:hypothetical protein
LVTHHNSDTSVITSIAVVTGFLQRIGYKASHVLCVRITRGMREKQILRSRQGTLAMRHATLRGFPNLRCSRVRFAHVRKGHLQLRDVATVTWCVLTDEVFAEGQLN